MYKTEPLDETQCGTIHMRVIFQIYIIYWKPIFHNSWFTNSFYIKINFRFITEILKIFNIFRKITFFNIEEGQNTFLVKFIKNLDFINIKIITVKDIFIVFIVQRRKIIDFVKEVRYILRVLILDMFCKNCSRSCYYSGYYYALVYCFIYLMIICSSKGKYIVRIVDVDPIFIWTSVFHKFCINSIWIVTF